MNPFTMLKEDHKKVKGLFQEYEGLGERANQKKQVLAEQIFHELEIHAQVEEAIFYPAMDRQTDPEGHRLINEAFEEHRLVKELIAELKKLEAGDELFEAKFKVMRENVEHHIKEEENELFPKAKEVMEAEKEEVGEEMDELKQELEEKIA